ncbi:MULTISPECIES: HAD family hydrolase [Methylomonas]|uniref:HAD family hydrolase n=2 Tax=Methylomonas koyamae TaxID=702114 RepID=A0AA91DFU1_9GAMM|nr:MULTISPECIES: hypothetical protein [Methylomonas]ANE56227.1 hypothetical protein AYM39_14245 [Methylomonas sp. DH-1]OAI29348.1 hypothetical protein A1356_04415 [Methylomonas koyamae]
MTDSIIYALDFDGVICDSALETALTGWKAAATIWSGMAETAPPELVEQFRAVRPIIETGYEAILVIRLLHAGETIESIYAGYGEKAQALMAEAGLTVAGLKQLFGDTRDQWIAEDRAGWIAVNPLFAGMAEKLRRLGRDHVWYVVTTKQERFVKKILTANDIELAADRIFGLDRNMSKPEVLKGLQRSHPGRPLYFVEDRLPSLQNVRKHAELADLRLGFALWGYNLPQDKALAEAEGCRPLLLENFLENAAGFGDACKPD